MIGRLRTIPKLFLNSSNGIAYKLFSSVTNTQNLTEKETKMNVHSIKINLKLNKRVTYEFYCYQKLF